MGILYAIWRSDSVTLYFYKSSHSSLLTRIATQEKNEANVQGAVLFVRVTATQLSDVKIIEPRVFGDRRGFFLESFNERALKAQGIFGPWVQDNHSRSARGVLRGLHYQQENSQGKLVRVSAGEIYDVSVDIRQGSPTFGKWVGIRLSAENHAMTWIPKGFAHGFLTLTEYADVIYKATDYYAPEYERTILWNDPEIGIEWPLDGLEPVLSAKDIEGVRLSDMTALHV